MQKKEMKKLKKAVDKLETDNGCLPGQRFFHVFAFDFWSGCNTSFRLEFRFENHFLIFPLSFHFYMSPSMDVHTFCRGVYDMC